MVSSTDELRLAEDNAPIELQKSTAPTNEPQANRHQEIKSVDGGYGWVCVVCQLLITANTWGINGAFGVYLSHYLEANTYKGTSQITYAFIGGLSISQITFIAPLVTLSGRRLGSRPTMAIGIIFETTALVAASFATQVWQLCLAQGVLFGWGCSFLYVGSIGIIPQWFTARRSLASAIAAAGSGLGGLSYSLGSQASIDSLGLRWSFRISAIVACTINTTCTLLMKDRNKQINPNQKIFDMTLFRRYRFWLIMAWAWLSTLGYTIILFALPDNAISIGLTTAQGSVVAAMANAGLAVGRPIVGYLSDKVGRVNMVCIATVLSSIFSFAFWVPANSYAVLIVCAFFQGTTCGTFFAVIAPLLAECLGIKQVPAGLSIVWTCIVFPTTFAAPLALAIRSSAGHPYLPVALLVGVLFAAGSLCSLLLRAEMHPESKTAGTASETASKAEEHTARAGIAYLRRSVDWVKV